MTTYNTGNPIGSTDPRDLYDNAQNLDTAMHTAATTWADRLGNSRPSWAGATGYQSLGDYAAGIQVTTYNQVIRAAGEYWRAAAGTALPYTTTGAGMPESGKFVSVGDAILRADLVDGDGSSLVGFQQAGTGAVTRTVHDKLREVVTAADFGILGNGTDETSKVQAALNYLNSIGGGELRFNGEVVRCDSPLIGYSNTKIIGTPGSTIDWSYRAAPFAHPTNPLDEGLLVFRGTAGPEILLSADAVYKTNKINVPDASLFSEGDLVEISMNDQGSFPDTSVQTRSGQLNILNGVYTGSNNLVLDTVILEPLGYTTANGARIRKITPAENIVIEGMTFKGIGRPATNTGGDLGVRIFFGRNVTVRNCKFDRVDGRAVEVISCHHFLIDNNEFYHDKLGDDNLQVSYSIIYSTSQYGTISNNKIVNPRHGIVSSHLSASLTNKYYGISRFIVINNNHITGNYGDVGSAGWTRSHAGISTHNDAEFVTITNNTVAGCRYGINPRTFNSIIANNILESNYGAGVWLSGVFRDLLISGNYISGGTFPIGNSSETFSDAHPNLVITNNTIESAGSVFITASTSTISPGLDFSGNRMLNYAGSSTSGMVIFNGAFTGKIQNNIIDNATIPGLRLENTRGLMVSGNHIYRTDRPINVLPTCQKTVIVNNTFIDNTNAVLALAASQSVVSGNHNFGTGAL